MFLLSYIYNFIIVCTAEASGNTPTLGQIDRNPQVVAKHELDNISLTSLESLSETIQETANRSEKEMVAWRCTSR